MKGLVSKAFIIISICTIIGCTKKEYDLDCHIYGEQFQIYSPILEKEKYFFDAAASDQSMNVFSSENHEMVIFITARFDSSYFKLFFEETHYQHSTLNGDTSDNNFSIPVSYSVNESKIIQEWLVFNNLASDHNATNRFSVKYRYSEINELSSIVIEFRKEFPSFNLLEVYNWMNKLRGIKIAKNGKPW
jgi:hypothetical protein